MPDRGGIPTEQYLRRVLQCRSSIEIRGMSDAELRSLAGWEKDRLRLLPPTTLLPRDQK